jgi:TP901-1 family phage major tail protein
MVKTTTTQPIVGNKVVYFTQSVLAALGAEAVMPAFQTEGNTTLGGEFLDEQSKQGRILQKSTDEHSVELTQYYAPDDESLIDTEEAQAEGRSQKVWRVVIDESVAEEGTGEEKLYPAHFGYGRVDEISYSDGADLVEASYTLNIVGRLQRGMFPLSDEDIAMINTLYEYQNPGETTGDYDNIQTEEQPAGE